MKILYIHGLGSSANSKTAKVLKEVYKDDEVLSFDIPFDPKEALDYVRELRDTYKPDLVIGSSLGGFYAMQLDSCRKILVNPAMYADIDIANAIGKGTYKYSSQRADGIQEYTIDDAYLVKLKEVREWFFNYCMIDDDFSWEMYGLFGSNDELFSHKEDFKTEFGKDYILGDFSHHLEEKDIKKYLIPLIDKVLNKSHIPNI